MKRFFLLLNIGVCGIIIMMNGCAARKQENGSVKNAVYILESVKDLPSGKVFSFTDYCAFNAARGAEDSALDRTLAETGARLELRFSGETAALTLEASNGDTSAAFLEYQKHYASRFFFTENNSAVELTLDTASLDEETQAAVNAMSAAERDTVLKSVFEKSKDTLIEPDEEDNVINYWRRKR